MKTLLAILLFTLPLPCLGQIGISNQSKVSVHVSMTSSAADSMYTSKLLMYAESEIDALSRAVLAKSKEQAEVVFLLDVTPVSVGSHLTAYAVTATALGNDKSQQDYVYINTGTIVSGVNTYKLAAEDVGVWVYDVLKEVR